MKNLKLCYILIFSITISLVSCQGNSSKTVEDSTNVEKPKPKNTRGYIGKWKEVDGDYFFTLEAREDGKVYFLYKDKIDANNTYPCEIKNGRGRNQKDEMVDIITILPKYKNGETLRSLFYEPEADVITTETYKRNFYERR